MTPKAETPTGRQRAKAIEGDRTTLRVPRRLEGPLAVLIEERGLTRNEALIALAELGAEVLDGERRAAVARERLEREVLSSVPAEGLPSTEAVEEAMIEARGGRG